MIAGAPRTPWRNPYPRRKDDPEDTGALLRLHLDQTPTPHTSGATRWTHAAFTGPPRPYTDVSYVASAVAYLATYHARTTRNQGVLFDVAGFDARMGGHDGATCATGVKLWLSEGYGLHGADWRETAPLARPHGAYRLTTVEETEHAIRWLGPVLMGFDWYKEWRVPTEYSELRTPMFSIDDESGDPIDKPMMGAAMALTTYDARRRLFTMHTPFGQRYGMRGQVHMTYFEFERQMHKKTDDAGLDLWAFLF